VRSLAGGVVLAVTSASPSHFLPHLFTEFLGGCATHSLFTFLFTSLLSGMLFWIGGATVGDGMEWKHEAHSLLKEHKFENLKIIRKRNLLITSFHKQARAR
jgi:hypothetical protein